jgi:predicted AAA+ superfamily ATPase
MEIAGSYLFRDILEFERIRSPYLLLDLLRLLAFQTEGEVSVNELSNNLGIDNKTVKRSLELLEKTYVVVKLRGYSGNLRKEITRHAKYYFVHYTGIRNAVIANFNPMELRNDSGALWENFLVVERMKKQAYTSLYTNNFFIPTISFREPGTNRRSTLLKKGKGSCTVTSSNGVSKRKNRLRTGSNLI